MEFDKSKAQNWLDYVSGALPGLWDILSSANSNLLLIGASAIDIYVSQNWCPALRRKTGDVDISVGLVSGDTDYLKIKNSLIALGYKINSPEIPYRFYPERQNPGGISYIDLLAHPASSSVSPEQSKRIMGIDGEFSFRGFQFAQKESLMISSRLFCPNVIAMVGLKSEAYLDRPEKRIKDLADIAELGWGLVERGTHFEMNTLWQKIKDDPSAKQVKKILLDLGSGESVKWDLENARQELLKRNFNDTEISETIPQRLTDWAQSLTE